MKNISNAGCFGGLKMKKIKNNIDENNYILKSMSLGKSGLHTHLQKEMFVFQDMVFTCTIKEQKFFAFFPKDLVAINCFISKACLFVTTEYTRYPTINWKVYCKTKVSHPWLKYTICIPIYFVAHL